MSKPPQPSPVDLFMSASRAGDVDTVQRLLTARRGWFERLTSNGVTPETTDAQGNCALHHAAEGGRRDVVALLLDAGAPVDPRNKAGQTPLHLACKAGFTDTARLLVEKGASREQLDAGGVTPLVHALCNDHFHIADEVFGGSTGPVLRPADNRALLSAWVLGKPRAVRWLLDHGASVRLTNELGETPLHTLVGGDFAFLTSMYAAFLETPAVAHGVETLCLLIQAGADVTAKTMAGHTPITLLSKAESNLMRTAGFAANLLEARGEGTERASALALHGVTLVRRMKAVLESCVTYPAPSDFATAALKTTVTARVPFVRLPQIIRAVLDEVKASRPDGRVPVSETMQGFQFSCPSCGALNPEAIARAVVGNWYEEMNKKRPIYMGPNVASLAAGWCPACSSPVVDIRFDPTAIPGATAAGAG